jgi:hypothetical protein
MFTAIVSPSRPILPGERADAVRPPVRDMLEGAGPVARLVLAPDDARRLSAC